jgi:hypothetical protein
MRAGRCDARAAGERRVVGRFSDGGDALGASKGWVTTEFDIDAAGRTANQRAIIAYPPFVFEQASVGIVKGARFEQRYRPEGGLGCAGWCKGWSSAPLIEPSLMALCGRQPVRGGMARTTSRSNDWGFPRWRGYGAATGATRVRMCDRHGCDKPGDRPAP